jgi:hypothetical protein
VSRDEIYPFFTIPVVRTPNGSAGATGLEPATSGVTGRRSNQLNYAPWRAGHCIGLLLVEGDPARR